MVRLPCAPTEPGKAADIVVLDGDVLNPLARQRLSSEIVRYSTRAEIRATIVDGRALYRDEAFATIDLERLQTEAAASAAHVRGVLAGRRYKPPDGF